MLKCQLIVEIERIIKANGWTQAEAAKNLESFSQEFRKS